MYDPRQVLGSGSTQHGGRLVPPGTIFTPAEIAELGRRSNLRGAALVLHAWATIGLAMALCAIWPNPLTIAAAVLVIGGRQLGLAILMHDAAHRMLLADRGLNDWVGTWLCGSPVIADLAVYRPYHLTHHRLVQSADDPDLVLSAPFPTSAAGLRRKILRDLTGRTALRQRTDLVRAALGSPARPIATRLRRAWSTLKGPLIANALLMLVATALGSWWLYPVLWLLPLATVYQLASRVRNIAEHAVVADNDDPFRNARTTYARRLERLVFAPYYVNYHLEHHLAMFIPCYRLPLAHRLLLAKGFGPRMEITAGGYRAVLAVATNPRATLPA